MTESTYWLKQLADKPAFPDLLWSRPETKRAAGKLLIVGGQGSSFAAPAAAYAAAVKAGIGTARVMLPDSLEKTLHKHFPEAEFADSTPSGSFAKAALGRLSEAAKWADGVLLAGGFGKNSETAVLLESFSKEYTGALTLAGDGLDYFIESDSLLVKRQNTASVMTVGQLQRLSVIDVESHLVLRRMNLVELVEVLHEWTGRDLGALIAQHSDQIVVAIGGKVSTTPAKSVDYSELAAHVSVWQLQQPSRLFEGLASAVYDYVSEGVAPHQTDK